MTAGQSDQAKPGRPSGRNQLLQVRPRIRWVTGEAGRAVSAAQGRALRDLLAAVAKIEVGQGEEDQPP